MARRRKLGQVFRPSQVKNLMEVLNRLPRSGSLETRPDSALQLALANLIDQIEELTESQRQAVILIYAMEWTEQEVAELIGRSRSTVRTHLERGLGQLRRALEDKVDV